MARRVVTVTARLAFLICGLVTFLTGIPYLQLRGESLPAEWEWIPFVIVFALLGGCTLLLAILPRAWIAKLGKTEHDHDRVFSVPLKLLGVFAALSYLVAVGAYFAPHTWNLNSQIMFLLCPMYFVKMTIDPSPVWTLFILAPMNAAVFGCLGVIVGYMRLRLRRQRAS